MLLPEPETPVTQVSRPNAKLSRDVIEVVAVAPVIVQGPAPAGCQGVPRAGTQYGGPPGSRPERIGAGQRTSAVPAP